MPGSNRHAPHIYRWQVAIVCGMIRRFSHSSCSVNRNDFRPLARALAENDSAASNDWALRPVNSTMCDGRKPGRHEWVSTMCALRKTMERPKTMERTTRRRHPCQNLSANPFADQGRSLPPPGPRLASLRSGVVVITKNPKIRALTQRRLWVSP